MVPKATYINCDFANGRTHRISIHFPLSKYSFHIKTQPWLEEVEVELPIPEVRQTLRNNPLQQRQHRKQSLEVKATSNTQSPAVDGNNKKQCISEPIEISSTVRESNLSSNPKDHVRDVQGSQTLNQNNGHVQNQGGVDEAWMRNSVEQIRDVVTNFTNFMMSNTMQTQHGYPDAFNALATPKNSSAETQTLIARMTPSSDRLIKFAPSQKMDSKGGGKKNAEGSPFRRVEILPFSEGQERGYYVNYETIHYSKYEGRKTGIVIPEWIRVLFKPPPYLVLDEIEACMASYIFGCNKDTKVMGRRC